MQPLTSDDVTQLYTNCNTSERTLDKACDCLLLRYVRQLRINVFMFVIVSVKDPPK